MSEVSKDSKETTKVNLTKENAEKGLIQLVLAIINLVKELMEKQAIHRIEAGSLTENQVNDIGETLLKLDEKISELRNDYGISEEDLEIDLNKYFHVK